MQATLRFAQLRGRMPLPLLILSHNSQAPTPGAPVVTASGAANGWCWGLARTMLLEQPTEALLTADLRGDRLGSKALFPL
eukprot:1801838-Prymnesium_polylepis.1